MIGKKWDGDGSSYKKAKMQWSGMTGWNDRRVAQRQQSYMQKKNANEYMHRRSERWSAWMRNTPSRLKNPIYLHQI